MIWEIPVSGGGIVNKFDGRKKRKKEEGEGLREIRGDGGERERRKRLREHGGERVPVPGIMVGN